MVRHHPLQIIGYHSCDKKVGLDVLSGKINLEPSNNDWDWLGDGVYFWEHDPYRALNYAIEVAEKKQFNKKGIETPFVIGAIIQLGNCLDLVASEPLSLLAEAYSRLKNVCDETGTKMPRNKDAIRNLDCAVIRYIHHMRKASNQTNYETIRSAFDEGDKVYEGANFASKNHIQVCVTNESLITGYFLPRPLQEFNPYLFKEFHR